MTRKTIREFLEDAMELQRAGDFGKALSIYNALESKGVVDPNLSNLMALAYLSDTNYQAAKSAALKANEQSKFESYYFLNTLGVCLKNCKEYKEAVSILTKSISIKETHENLNNLANCLYETNNYTKAAELYEGALRIKPDMIEPYENLSSIYLNQNNYSQALKVLTRAHKNGAVSQNTIKSRINVLIKEEHFAEARRLLKTQRDTYGEDYKYRHNQIKILIAEKSWDEVKRLSVEVKAAVEHPNVIISLAYGLEQMGESKMATLLLSDLKNSKNPELHDRHLRVIDWNQSQVSLRSGDVKIGWNLFGNRFYWDGFPSEHRSFDVPKLAKLYKAKGKRVLLWREQGLGDEFLHLMLVKEFIEKGMCEVIIEPCERLLNILKASLPNACVRSPTFNTSDYSATVHDFDYHVPFGDLAPLLKFGANGFESARPYLKYDENLKACHNLKASKDTIVVGMAWRSQIKIKERQVHYTQLNDWEPLFALPNVTVVNLQYDNIESDVRNSSEVVKKNLVQLDVDLKNDMQSIAAVMANCDVVVAPFNAVLMQAAALGVPTLSYGIGNMPMALGEGAGVEEFSYPWFKNNKTFNKDELPTYEIIERITYAVKTKSWNASSNN